MECPICYLEFNDEKNCPKILSCGHVCKYFLTIIIKSSLFAKHVLN